MHESEGTMHESEVLGEEKAAASASFACCFGVVEMQESSLLRAFLPWHGAC